MRYFADESTEPSRALQIYLVLIGLAWNRQTVTYGDISKNQIEYGIGRNLAFPLGCILHWCVANKLPPLTSLVVNKDNGLPGDGFGQVEDVPSVQQKVFALNWFAIFPPTVEELAEVGKKSRT